MDSLQTSRSSKWIAPDFFSAQETPAPRVSKKRTRDEKLAVTRSKKLSLSLLPDELWLDKYKPVSADQLSVQPKKVEEVRAWLTTHLNSGGILLLTGPPGCGKTAVVNHLASELNLAIQEWITPIDQVDYNADSRSILESVYIHDDTTRFNSQTQLFKDWLKAAKFPVFGEEDVRKLVLLEDFPSFATRNPKDFQEILTNYRRGKMNPPMVVVCSEDSGWKDSVLKLVFNLEFTTKADVSTISFNPATTTNLVKMLTRLVTEETKNKDRSLKVPDKTSLESLVESSNCDIRACINALQFSCIQNTSDFSSIFQSDETPSTSKKSKKVSGKKSAKSQSSVGAKDQSLILFHALGKILYAKRDTVPEKEPLPPHLEKHRRNPLQAVPEDVYFKTAISEEGFTCFLHHNFPAFYSDIHDAAALSSYLSESDLLLREWGTTGKMDVKEYGVSLASRATMFFNQHQAKVTGRRTLTKPQLYSVNRTIDSNLTRVQSALSGVYITQPRSELYTSTVPLLAKLKPKLIPQHKLNTIIEVGRISGVPQCTRSISGSEDLEMFSEDDDEMMNLLSSIDPAQPSNTTSQISGAVVPRAGGDKDDDDDDYTIEDFDDFD